VGGSNDDLNGHGTHIAGIASSQTYGVARFASVVSVKVLGDEGSSTGTRTFPLSHTSESDVGVTNSLSRHLRYKLVGSRHSE